MTNIRKFTLHSVWLEKQQNQAFPFCLCVWSCMFVDFLHRTHCIRNIMELCIWRQFHLYSEPFHWQESENLCASKVEMNENENVCAEKNENAGKAFCIILSRRENHRSKNIKTCFFLLHLHFAGANGINVKCVYFLVEVRAKRCRWRLFGSTQYFIV